MKAIPNPNYVNAPYEIVLLNNDGTFIHIPWPYRFNKVVDLTNQAEVERESIPPYIEVEDEG